jgi:hypothetical protein
MKSQVEPKFLAGFFPGTGKKGLIILRAVDGYAVPFCRFLVEGVKNIQTLLIPALRDDPFPLRKANVITTLGLHCPENLLFGYFKADKDRIRRLDIRSGPGERRIYPGRRRFRPFGIPGRIKPDKGRITRYQRP